MGNSPTTWEGRYAKAADELKAAEDDGHMVLGRVALKRGDVETAKRELLLAGATPGSPQLDSFGPNMSLAKDLLEKKQADTVIEYFALCVKFWKLEDGNLIVRRRPIFLQCGGSTRMASPCRLAARALLCRHRPDDQLAASGRSERCPRLSDRSGHQRSDRRTSQHLNRLEANEPSLIA